MKFTIVVMIALLAGCASGPVIDQRGLDQEKYAFDLKECEALRLEATRIADDNLLIGFENWTKRGTISKRCMQGRGYNILN
jgi:hypothetical protein